MLSGFSKAAQVFQNDSHKCTAVNAASFLLKYLWSENENKLLHCCYADENRENIVKSYVFFFLKFSFLEKNLEKP